MKSSANRLEDTISASSELIDYTPGHASHQSQRSSSTTLSLPSFDSAPIIQAQTAKIAGRINAASVSEDEHLKLLNERQHLLDKKFANTITRQESNRLEYVRWSLDRIEDAKYGSTLDSLEESVTRYEQFLDQLRGLENQLRQASPKYKKK